MSKQQAIDDGGPAFGAAEWIVAGDDGKAIEGIRASAHRATARGISQTRGGFALESLMLRIPIRRSGVVVNHMLIDASDAFLKDTRWCMNIDGYAARSVTRNGMTVCRFAHRVVLEGMLGRSLSSHERTDHINGDKLDNRRENLRAVTHSQNMQNRHGVAAHNRSGYRGVYRTKMGTWRGCARLNGRTYHCCGVFASAAEADLATQALRTALGFLTNTDTKTRARR